MNGHGVHQAVLNLVKSTMRIFVRLPPSGRCSIKFAIPVHASKRCVKHATSFTMVEIFFFSITSFYAFTHLFCYAYIKIRQAIITLKTNISYFQHNKIIILML